MAWKSLLEKSLAANKSLPYARYFQLATVRANGRPACRTVVYRGFLEDSDDSITFCTDTRTEKIEQVQRSAAVEACWYFEDSREQYRLAGDLIIVDGSCSDSSLAQARERLWATLSGKARAQFTYPQPGAPRDIDSEIPVALAPDPPPAEEGAATGTFALAVLAVRSVDYLVLTENERRCFTRAEGSSDWQETLLNP